MNYWTQSKKNIFVAAHRGDSEKYPENTMAAFKAALDYGVDQIETDVRCTKDGVLVLIHDKTVDRTTDGSGLVADKTYEELLKLEAGTIKGVTGHKIPTLKELLELVKDHPTVTLDIELKVYPEENQKDIAYEVCDRVIEMIEDYGFGERTILNSFSSKLHEYIFEKYKGKYKQHVFFPYTRNISPSIDPYSYAYCACMFREEENEIIASKQAFEQMELKGVQPWVGASVKDEHSVDIAIKRGAVLITCNNPDDILKILKDKGFHS